MTNVQSLDDVLLQLDNESKEKEFAGSKRTKKTLGSTTKKPKENNDLLPTNRALTKNADNILNRYIRKSPQFKIIQKQIDLLKEELIKYNKSGEIDLVEKTKKLILDLNVKKQQFIQIAKNKTPEDKEENQKKIKNSPKIKQLKGELEDLITYYKNTNPNSLMKQLSEFRNAIGDVYDSEIIDLDDVTDEDALENPTSKTYKELCNTIATLIDEIPENITKLPLNTIKTQLIKCTPDLTSIKEQIEYKKMEISNETKKLKGSDEIVDIMFEIFDFKYEEDRPKEMLAASNIKYVSSIAYNICSRLNMLHQFDDAVSYGLVGLTVAINKWLKAQKMVDSALSFEGYAYRTITGAIQRGLYELSSSGRVSGSVLATMMSKKKKHLELFVSNNPEFKNLPPEILEELVADDLDVMPGKVIGESEMTQMVGGDEGGSDIWSNAIMEKTPNNHEIMEAKEEYSRFIQGIKDLFNLFETKEDKNLGVKWSTDKKVFNKYDFKLFKLYFGLEFKKDVTNTNGQYSQEEIAKILEQYYAADGITKTFSQPAINARINSLLTKIKIIMDENPSIKAGFERIYTYWQSNQDTLNSLSNIREGYGLNINQKETDNIYTDKDLNRILSDNRTIAQISNDFEENPLDSEIANYFQRK